MQNAAHCLTARDKINYGFPFDVVISNVHGTQTGETSVTLDLTEAQKKGKKVSTAQVIHHSADVGAIRLGEPIKDLQGTLSVVDTKPQVGTIGMALTFLPAGKDRFQPFWMIGQNEIYLDLDPYSTKVPLALKKGDSGSGIFNQEGQLWGVLSSVDRDGPAAKNQQEDSHFQRDISWVTVVTKDMVDELYAEAGRKLKK